MTRLLVLFALACGAYFLFLGPRRASQTAIGRWLIGAAAITLAFLYLRSPIDVIPDTTGLVGFLDDVIVIAYIAWWLRSRMPNPEQPRQAPPQSEPRRGAAWDPYAVLGVPRGASRDEISAAYRRRMKEYHPDRVSGLGEELQRVAHEKTLEIQRAYEQLKGG